MEFQGAGEIISFMALGKCFLSRVQKNAHQTLSITWGTWMCKALFLWPEVPHENQDIYNSDQGIHN